MRAAPGLDFLPGHKIYILNQKVSSLRFQRQIKNATDNIKSTSPAHGIAQKRYTVKCNVLTITRLSVCLDVCPRILILIK